MCVQHFKDLICMRRNDLEVLRRLPKEEREGGGGGGGSKDPEEEGGDAWLVLPRERCLRVVRGLMALLLSMDFSCHVDLFLVACKVSRENKLLKFLTFLNFTTWAEHWPIIRSILSRLVCFRGDLFACRHST